MDNQSDDEGLTGEAAAEALRCAVLAGDLSVVRDLLAGGMNADTPLHTSIPLPEPTNAHPFADDGAAYVRSNPYPAIALAARRWDAPMVQLLLDAGADPLKEFDWGRNLLDLAARAPLPGATDPQAFDATVATLLRAGLFIDDTHTGMPTLLQSLVAERAPAHMIRTLLDHGADPYKCDSYNADVFVLAAQQRHVEALVALEEAGYQPGHRLHGNDHLLYTATSKVALLLAQPTVPGTGALKPQLQEYTRMARYLIGHGASWDEPYNEAGATIVHYLAGLGTDSPRAIEFLLGLGASADLPDQQGRSPLFAACSNWNVGSVDVLLRAGADAKRVASDGMQPLHAAMNGQPTLSWGDSSAARLIDMLNLAGADLQARDDQDNTPLHYAALRIDPGPLVALLGYFVDIDPRNREGMTPFLLAASKGRTAMIELLVALGANAQAKTWQEEGVLHLLSMAPQVSLQTFLDTAKFCIGHGADINAQDKQGRSALLCAVNTGHVERAVALLSLGADATVRDCNGRDCLMAVEEMAPGSPDHEQLKRALYAANARATLNDLLHRLGRADPFGAS